jgi:DNA-binding CsgD family transcriptional regulator
MAKVPDNNPLLTCEEHIKNICSPFMATHQRLAFLDYMRLYKDGSCSPLSINAAATKYFFENDHTSFKYITLNPKAKNNVRVINSALCADEYMSNMKNFFRLDNILVITEKHFDYLDLFAIGGHAEDNDILNYYLEILSTLESFAKDFLVKTKKIIEEAQKNRLIPIEEVRNIYKGLFVKNHHNDTNQKQIDQKKILSVCAQPRFLEMAADNHILLSSREHECLSYLRRGYTMKAAAQQMEISPRTVETHFKKIKYKLKCYSKNQVLKLLDTEINH